MDIKKHVSISNSSDPYTPPENELCLTRETLQVLFSRGINVQLITKSSLVIRDIDLIRRGNCAVSMTITSENNRINARLEPRASPTQERFKALMLLHKAGVPTMARIDPIIPGINDENIEQLVKSTCATGVQHVTASTCKLRVDSFNRLVDAFPSEREKLLSLYCEQGEKVGSTRYLPVKLRKQLLSRVRDAAVAEGITFGICREGLSELDMGPRCDGSHLIPNRRSSDNKSAMFVNDGNSI